MSIITTLAGAFIFGFMVKYLFGKFTGEWGAVGGFACTACIIGLCWSFNHGIGGIVQNGAWIDQGFAAFSGLFFADVLNKKFEIKTAQTIMIVMVGGVIGGIVSAAVSTLV